MIQPREQGVVRPRFPFGLPPEHATSVQCTLTVQLSLLHLREASLIDFPGKNKATGASVVQLGASILLSTIPTLVPFSVHQEACKVGQAFQGPGKSMLL